MAWDSTIGGDYTPPPKPSGPHLKDILEAAYLATLETDEARPLQFNICVTLEGKPLARRRDGSRPVEVWPFREARRLGVQELRRLAAATNLDSSTIWVTVPAAPDASPMISGLLNLGSSWSKARSAFTYSYDPLPHAMLVRCDAPGRLTVYQGEYAIACLKGGRIVRPEGPSSLHLLGVHRLLSEGQDLLGSRIRHPRTEYAGDWHSFEFLAYTNTVLAVVNSIQDYGHGGTLILAGSGSGAEKTTFLRSKYQLADAQEALAIRFSAFMNARHVFGDLAAKADQGKRVARSRLELAHQAAVDRQEDLGETCGFVGRLAATDGALVLTTGLKVLGFGTEIVLDQLKPGKVWQVLDGPGHELEELDTEQFGTRHRSAMRLCGTMPHTACFVVSQDGGVTVVWQEKGQVRCRRDIRTANVNMVLP